MMRPVKNNMQNAFIFQQGVIRLLFAGAVVRFAVVRFAVIRWRVIHPLARICNPCHHLNINSKTLLPLVSERGVHG